MKKFLMFSVVICLSSLSDNIAFANYDGTSCVGTQGYVWEKISGGECDDNPEPEKSSCEALHPVGSYYDGSPVACSAGEVVTLHHFTPTCPDCGGGDDSGGDDDGSCSCSSKSSCTAGSSEMTCEDGSTQECPYTVLTPSCDGSNACWYDEVEGTCMNCQGELPSLGSSTCEALITVKCEDPFDNNAIYSGNWGGEWDEFDRIVNYEWVQNGEDWCNDADPGRNSNPDGGEADCWTIECHQIIKCRGAQCTAKWGDDGRLCAVNEDETAFVWQNQERKQWCTQETDPEIACNDKCPNETVTLALVDGVNPNITPLDGNGDPIDETDDENVATDNSLVATAGQLIAADTQNDDIHWYNTSFEATPDCEDIEADGTSVFFICDRSGQNCNTSNSYSSTNDCLTAITDDETCKEVQQYMSDCLEGSEVTVNVTDHLQQATVKQSDRAGNEGEATTDKIYIDYNKPEIDNNLTVSITTIGFEEDDKTMEIFPTQTEGEKLVAHDEYKITISLQDSNDTTSAEGYNSGISGIDWDNSTIILSTENGERTSFIFSDTNNSEFSFTRTTSQTFNPDTQNFTETAEISFSGTIFQTAETKTIDLVIKDRAGNILNTDYENSSIEFEIGAGTASEILLDTESCEQTLANNIDTCEIQIGIFDKFGNPVTERDVQLVKAIGQNASGQTIEQDIDGNYNLVNNDGTSNEEQAFLNGIRMAEIKTNPEASDGDSQFIATLPIRAMVPTLYIKSDTVGDDTFMFADDTINDEFSGRGVAARNISLILDVEKVDGASYEKNEYERFGDDADEDTNVSLTFLPWVYLKMTDKATCENVSDPLEISLGDEALDINLCVYTGIDGGIEEKSLPTTFDTYVIGHSPAETDFRNQDIDKDLIGEEGLRTEFLSGLTKQTINTYLQAAVVGNTGDLSDIAVTSNVKITFPEEGDKVVSYPGEGFGLYGEFGSYLIGADIEGGILGESYSYEDETEIVKMGGVSATDIREALTSNAFQLVRGLESQTNTDMTTSVDFSSENVKYFKNKDVKIGGKISGVGTIVIEDGNLTIEKDLFYESTKDSLGIILINTNTDAEPDNGNIFIKTNVKNIVGTYFADGALISGTSKTAIDYTDENGNYQDILMQQLILEGTIFTKNTLGGSLGEQSGNLFTSWGSASSIGTARQYDLHFIRRYIKTLIDVTQRGAPCNGSTIDDIPCNDLCVPSKNNPQKCDKNPHAFVIRPDGRVKTSPPPGFSNINTIK